MLNVGLKAAGDFFEGMVKRPGEINKALRKDALSKAATAKNFDNIKQLGKAEIQNISSKDYRTFGQKAGNIVGGTIRDTMYYSKANSAKMKSSGTSALKLAHQKDQYASGTTKAIGSYMGASAVGRVASGGGLFKDKNGRTNLIGVPFI